MTTITSTHSDLSNFFKPGATPSWNQEQWDCFRDRFSSTPNDLVKPLHALPVDFSGGQVEQRWQDTALKICRIVLMILIFPWGLYVGLRYLLQRLIMFFIFPLQSNLVKNCCISKQALDEDRQNLQAKLNFSKPTKPYLVRQIVLEKNGARYRALMVATAQSLATRQWVLQAPGNIVPIEACADKCARLYTQALQSSLLIVQGPGAGGNDGEVPSTDLGEPFELALSYLEKDFDPQRIVLCGHSLGAASVGQAIKKHTFDTEKRKYIVVRQVGFDTTPNMAYRWIGFNKCCCVCPCLGRIGAALVKWAGCTLDNVEASRILQDKQITEVVIQAGMDRVIPTEASLANALEKDEKDKINQNKIFKYLPYEGHTTDQVTPMTLEAFNDLGLLPSPTVAV